MVKIKKEETQEEKADEKDENHKAFSENRSIKKLMNVLNSLKDKVKGKKSDSDKAD